VEDELADDFTSSDDAIRLRLRSDVPVEPA